MPRELFADPRTNPSAYRSYVGTHFLHDMRISWDDIPSRKESETLLTRFGLGEAECEFVGYWEADGLYEPTGDAVKVSVYHRPSTGQAILVALNVTNDAQVLKWKPRADFGASGTLTDPLQPAESPVKESDAWTVPLKPYDYRLLQIGATNRRFWP